jgi:hypothetical protein
VEETLASLESRLRALQAELDADDEPAPAPRRFTPRADQPPPAPPAPAPASDALDRFGEQLRRLVALWEQTAAELRGGGGADATIFRDGVALEARGDLADLCALDRALRDVPAVGSVVLRAYAGGAAALEVALEGEVALIAELRRSLSFEVVEVHGARLSIRVS